MMLKRGLMAKKRLTMKRCLKAKRGLTMERCLKVKKELTAKKGQLRERGLKVWEGCLKTTFGMPGCSLS